jgi:ABC-type branched-subunit amino acid transport system substrate-binding protein
MTRRKTVTAALAAVLLALGAAAGCGDDDDSDGGEGGGGGGAVGELKVGVLVPLTGDLASYGGPGAKAAELAASQINAAAQAAGVDVNVTLAQEDTASEAQGAQEAATKLIETDAVTAFAGPYGSGEVIPVAENVAGPAGVPLVTPSATQADITELGAGGLVFRTSPSDALQGEVLAQVVGEAFGPDASVVTANRNDAYGTGLIEGFTTAWEAGGGTVVRNVPYNPEAASLNSEAAQVVEGNPDGWVIVDYPDTWPKMGPALVRTGDWDPARTFGADGLRSSSLPQDAGREATEGMRGTAPTSAEAPGEPIFDRLWNQEVGDPRQTFDSQQFDAVVLIALAAVAAGSSDPADIAENIGPVSGPEGEKFGVDQLEQALAAAANGDEIDYEGASGPIDLDENGDPGSADYATWVYRNGRLADEEVISASAAE